MDRDAGGEWTDMVAQIERLSGELDSWTRALSLNPSASPKDYVPDLRVVYERLKSGMGRSSDVLIRRLAVPSCPERILVASVDGITDTTVVDEDVLKPLMTTTAAPAEWDEAAVFAMDITQASQWPDITQSLASGKTVVFVQNLAYAWVIDTAKFPQRSVQRPQTELAVRGPEEAFNEVLGTQKAQIRHHLPSPDLIFDDFTIGRIQSTTVSLAYLDGLTNPALVTTVTERLRAINVDGLVGVTQVAGLIRDHPRSIFPTIRQTERVEMAVWRILQGAVVVLMDGDPFALIAPAPLIDFYRTAMDYSSSWIDSSFVRGIRFFGWALGIYLPALFVALTEVNPSVLPAELLASVQGSAIGLPFPEVIQVILMVLVIETLREASLRLPKPLSTTIGTVGAIVVGTAIVKAGLVDTQIIVIMTLTALSLFSTPVYELTSTWRIIGFLMLGASYFFGLVGITLVTMGVIAVLVDMRTFGAQYFEPWAPFRVSDWGDAIWRLPWTMVTQRWSAPRPLHPRWHRPETVNSHPRLKRGKMGS